MAPGWWRYLVGAWCRADARAVPPRRSRVERRRLTQQAWNDDRGDLVHKAVDKLNAAADAIEKEE